MFTEPITLEPHIRAVPMALFPTLGSIQEVITLADSKVPVISKNEMFSLLMTYHNTLLAVLVAQGSLQR